MFPNLAPYPKRSKSKRMEGIERSLTILTTRSETASSYCGSLYSCLANVENLVRSHAAKWICGYFLLLVHYVSLSDSLFQGRTVVVFYGSVFLTSFLCSQRFPMFSTMLLGTTEKSKQNVLHSWISSMQPCRKLSRWDSCLNTGGSVALRFSLSYDYAIAFSMLMWFCFAGLECSF